MTRPPGTCGHGLAGGGDPIRATTSAPGEEGWADRGGDGWLQALQPIVGSNKRPRTARSAQPGPTARVRSGADRGRRRGRGRESVWIGREGAREGGVPALGGGSDRTRVPRRSVGWGKVPRALDSHQSFGLWCSSLGAGALGSALQEPLRRRLRAWRGRGCWESGELAPWRGRCGIRSRGPCSRAWAALGAPVGARSGLMRGVWGGGGRQSAGGGSWRPWRGGGASF